MARQPYHTAFHGHRDQKNPYSLVVRYGTRGETMEQTAEQILTKNLGGPYATHVQAFEAKKQIPENLRPFVEISKFSGWA